MAADNVRKPKQKRSIELKAKIVQTAFDLFCRQGFYRTTTNEIAKRAGISIGSLYSYFKDKDAILLEILGKYHEQFMSLRQESIASLELFKSDKRAWVRNLIERLIALHEASKQFNRELNVLYYSKADVEKLLDEQTEETRLSVLEYLSRWKHEIKRKDLEAASVVAFELISALVHDIVFRKNPLGRERLITEGVEAVCKYLLG
jgi:AcrR family transcriptional regulator